jgi:hypothetical protein
LLYLGQVAVVNENLFSIGLPKSPSPLTKANCMDFFSINNVKLTAIQKDSCEGEITEEELIDAVKAFKSGKTPGIPNLF